MSNLPQLKVEVFGPEHSGKTSLVALLTHLLKDKGIDVVLQRADGQLDEKLANPEACLERLRGERVFLFEMETRN